MPLRFSFFKRPYQKMCNVYLHRQNDSCIAASVYNHDVFFAEYKADKIELHSNEFEKSILLHYDQCIYKSRYNYWHRKPKDWPAFQASGVKTIKKFQLDYIMFSILGANESNNTLALESQEFSNGIGLRSSLAYRFEPFELKTKLIEMRKGVLTLEKSFV